MPTLAQLRSEPWWDREIVTEELDWLGDELCRRTGRPRTAAGTKGNEAHLRGAHRSQEWIKRSRYCTNRTYTVQGGLTATQERHVAGFDFTPGSAEQMIAQCRRIYAAARSGRLEEVREFYGNVDGDQRVDGWDNVDNEPASSDSSHLWHWHLSIDRRRLTDRALMERILAVALGEDNDVGTLEGKQAQQLNDTHYTLTSAINNPVGAGSVPFHVWAEWLTGMVKALAGSVDIDAAELARIESAAKAGATSAADGIVTRVLAGLPEGTLTKDDVAAAVREVLLTGAGPA